MAPRLLLRDVRQLLNGATTSDLPCLLCKTRQIACHWFFEEEESHGPYFEPAFDAASKITPATFDGWASIMTWLEGTVVVVAPILFA
jgi:hypothetical protein